MNEKTEQYIIRLVNLMKEYDVSMVEAMDFDFDIAMVDVSSSLDLCDYLEEQTNDLVFVDAFLAIWDGRESDFIILKEPYQ
jgi:hypothetical protein